MRFDGSPFRVAAALLFALMLSAPAAFAQADSRRETVAVSYPLEQTVSLKFRGTTRLPRLSGSAKVRRTGRRNTRVELGVDNLPRAYEVGGVYTTYVLWAISPEGRADNLGELKRSGSNFIDTKIDVTTPLETFALIVTAEPHSSCPHALAHGRARKPPAARPRRRANLDRARAVHRQHLRLLPRLARARHRRPGLCCARPSLCSARDRPSASRATRAPSATRRRS